MRGIAPILTKGKWNMSKELDMQQQEIDALKLLCDNASISYHPSIGLDKLREKVAAYEKAKETKEIKTALANQGVAKINASRLDALKLIRVRVACMNPDKREYQGEYFTASNRAAGTVTRMVPFGVDWHIESILLDMLQDKVFRQSYDVPDGKGGKARKNRFVKAYAIEILPALTTEELKELSASQLARNAITED